jgi:hypothetical protein
LQGFPDYFALAAKVNPRQKTWVRNVSLTERYQQLGNAVCPLVADALGRCLALAARGRLPVGQHIVSVPNPEFEEVRTQHIRESPPDSQCTFSFKKTTEFLLIWSLSLCICGSLGVKVEKG